MMRFIRPAIGVIDRLLAIQHNGNLSNGLMFAEVTLTDNPLDPDYAERRARWEPLYEVTQMKGDGATAHNFSPAPGDCFGLPWNGVSRSNAVHLHAG